jgi:hypothetical protein
VVLRAAAHDRRAEARHSVVGRLPQRWRDTATKDLPASLPNRDSESNASTPTPIHHGLIANRTDPDGPEVTDAFIWHS